MRKLPHWTIFAFAIAGLTLGITTGIVNKHVNTEIHKRFPKDGPVVSGASLVLQFAIIIGVLMIAATFMPFINPDDLGGGVASFAFGNLYFTSQVHFVNEITKFVDGNFDDLERYKSI
jgi:hypothetical protein